MDVLVPMGRIYGGLLALAMGLGVAHAERRALVVGVDVYDPPEYQAALAKLSPFKKIKAEGRGFNNLPGAAKDAQAVAAVLTQRYGITDVRQLLGVQATRAALLAALGQLLDDSQPGDTAVFFYAGHGSQITNTTRPPGDQIEQTLVPADAWRGAIEALPEPVDIRDQTLAALYNKALDRGVKLLVILDACHSGGSWRWVPKQGFRTRALAADRRRYALPSYDGPNPAERGLFIAASAATEPALEADGGGAFTQALLTALDRLPGDAPVDALFARAVVALREATGSPQRPTLAGPAARRLRPLLTGAKLAPPADLSLGRTRVAVAPKGAPPVVAQVAKRLGEYPEFQVVEPGLPCELELVWQPPARLHWRLCRRGPLRDLLPADSDPEDHLMGQAERFDRTRRWLARTAPATPAGTLTINGRDAPPHRLVAGERFTLSWSGPTEATYISVVDSTLGGARLCGPRRLDACAARSDPGDPSGPLTFTVSTWSRPLTGDEQARVFTWAGQRAATKGDAGPPPKLLSLLHVPAWMGPDPSE